MEREANYVAVGAFIVLVLAMGIAFVLWYSDASDRREYRFYEIYFKGSVSGLNRGSPVRYLGVDVGRVRSLGIDRDDPGSVRAVVEVDNSAPITGATRASLGLQGVTGLLYVNLDVGPGRDPAQPLKQGQRYLIIESAASNFDMFLASVPELMGRANHVVDRVSRVFSDQNLQAVDSILSNLRQSSAKLPATTENAGALIADMRAAVTEIRGAASGLRGMTEDARPEVSAALARLGTAAGNLEAASARIDNLIAGSEKQLTHFSNQGLFEVEQLVRESRAAAREFRDLSRSLKENPSQLLYEPPSQGVRIDP